LDNFQSASKGDFSPFRIKDSEMRAPVPQLTGLEPIMKDYKYCDPAIFKARVSGVVHYVMMVSSIHTGKAPASGTNKSQGFEVHPFIETDFLGTLAVS
jgi:hypothetical protein